MMHRFTRVGNYYYREEPPKARVWDDDKKGMGNGVNDCNHVLVTDADGGIRSSLKRTRSFSAKNLFKTKSLQNVSRKSSKKLVRSMSTYSNPYKKEFKASESKTSLSTEVDPTYKILKDALVIRSQSTSSSRQSLRGSRKTSESSNRSKTSFECTQGNEKSQEIPNQYTITKETSRTLSESPTLFHKRVLKNQNKELANGPVNYKSNGLKPLSIEIPIETKKNEADEIEVHRSAVQQNQSCDSHVETKCFGNNSPSGGSNASSKSVHFATDVRAMSDTPSAIVKSHLSFSNKKPVSENTSPIETNLDECIVSVTEKNNTMVKSNLGIKHKDSFPLNERRKLPSPLCSPTYNQSDLGKSDTCSTLDKMTIGDYKSTSMPRQASGTQVGANGDWLTKRSGQSRGVNSATNKISAPNNDKDPGYRKATDSPVLVKIAQAREKTSRAVPYKGSEYNIDCESSHTNSNAPKNRNHSYIERKKESGMSDRRNENIKYSKPYENEETPIYSKYDDVNVNNKTTILHTNRKLPSVPSQVSQDINLNSPANHQYQQVNQSLFALKKVPSPTPLASKYSKSAIDLKHVNMTTSLSMPLSSKLILTGDFPGYQPPNADAIPFVDDSIPYVLDDPPPLSLTPVSIIKSNLEISDTSQLNGSLRPKSNKHYYKPQDQERDRKPTTNSRETHLITIKIETDKSETNETKVMIHDNKIQDQNGNEKWLSIIFWSALGIYL